MTADAISRTTTMINTSAYDNGSDNDIVDAAYDTDHADHHDIHACTTNT